MDQNSWVVEGVSPLTRIVSTLHPPQNFRASAASGFDWYPTKWKRSICIANYIQTTFFYLGKFLKKLSEEQCSKIRKDSIYHIKHMFMQHFTIGVNWSLLLNILMRWMAAIIKRHSRFLSSYGLQHASKSSLVSQKVEIGFSCITRKLPYQVKTQYLQILNIVDTSIKHQVSVQSIPLPKGCM